MTAPRQILRGTTYLVTRRCAHRQFLLKPSKTTNNVFLFLLAVAARRYGVEIHAFCVLSNHVHLIVTDPDARLPAFHQFLDALVARAINASLGRWEAFWAPNSYSAVALASPTDVIEKAAYVLANPVAARLVRTARLWPGLWSAPEQIGGDAIEVKRPKHFFDPKGALPDKAMLQLTAPPGFASADEFRAKLEVALAEREEQAARGGRGFLGVARVLAQKATGRPASGEPRRSLNPRVASRDKWKRIETLGRLVEFLRAYRSAWASRRAGNAEAIFPPGTYLMRVAHDVRCAGFG
ncbi:transposase [Anaeromyxobacter terrae]|uniref:transposase n=1 Tax=Anaeromyxobacter terrae TaxID=2925406 RepID=UPI001F5726CD|nr:transposase [Anaeromyxobacter sp. SG22]